MAYTGKKPVDHTDVTQSQSMTVTDDLTVSGTITQPTGSVENSSGNALFNLKRTNTNTTGRVGGINFLASDGHSVAGISAIGDGDNEGAYLRFDATSAASSSEINSNEVMRLRQNGELIITSDGSDNDGAHIQLTHANNNSTDVIGSILFANNVGEAARIQAETVGANNTGLLKMFIDLAGTSRQVFGVTSGGSITTHYNTDNSSPQRSFYDTLINRGTDAELLHLNGSLGTTGDPSGCFVLLCEAYDSTLKDKSYCYGRVLRQRGTTVNGLVHEDCLVSVQSAYNSNQGGGYCISGISPTPSIVTCTYSSVKYIALKMENTSAAEVSCDLWYGSVSSGDHFKPIMVDDGAVSSVSTLQALTDI